MALSNSAKPQETEEDRAKRTALSSTQYLVETIKQLQTTNEQLKLELLKSRGIPSGKIGIAFMLPGVLALASSIYTASPVLAFIGLGLTFWGALFFFVRPVKYVRSTLLDSAAITSYSTIDRIIKDLNYQGKSFHIPPYPRDVYLPEYLKGLKNMIVFISADSGSSMPSVEDIAQSRFLTKDPKGISVAPPGLGLLTLIENEMKTDITTLSLEDLYSNLQKTILENFQLAKEVEILPQDDTIQVRIHDSIYKNLYSKEANLQSIHFLGCPIVSAIACAVAKNTGKIVTIQKSQVSADGETIQVELQYRRE